MNEIWKDIDGYVGHYQVSNLGRVRSVDVYVNCWRGKRLKKGKVLKQVKNKNGYKQVILQKDGKIKNHYVHRLVAETFITNQDNLPEVNHIDENKSNNIVYNLEYCDKKYNLNYGTRIEKIIGKIAKPVLQFTKSGEFIKEYQSSYEARRHTGVNQSNITQCCRGKVKSAGNFIWKYK